jgi:anthraniloyl-CoA monooxygenase
MRINVLGGGPAGLYFSILMKLADRGCDITVYERNAPDSTFGWGVVFSGKTMARLRDADPVSHAAITAAFEQWDNVDVAIRDARISIHGNSFSGIARLGLLQILQERAAGLGVEVRYRTEITDVDSLRACDLLVGADGLNSTVRSKWAEHFQPSLDIRPNRYIWYGTRRLFHGLTLTFRECDYGLFIAHSYKFSRDLSTFIVECDPTTWTAADFACMTDVETRGLLGEIFAQDLDGHELLSNNSRWTNFTLVKNARWCHENVVLVGDALHTAHFSIGSGTKLALEDCIALARCLSASSNVQAALEEYERARRPSIDEYQAAAFESMVWFERAAECMHLEPLEFAYRLMIRSPKVTHENLRMRDPEFVARYERLAAG